MNLSNLKPNTQRKSVKRVGRGGKRGTYSGKGMKGQKSRAGAGVKPGFRGGDNRIWQLFPKQRGASKKPGGSGIYAKHRFYQMKREKTPALNVEEFNKFSDGDSVNPKILFEKGLIDTRAKKVKILGTGKISKKLTLEGFKFSKSAREKIEKAGGIIK